MEYKDALDMHLKNRGKLEVISKVRVETKEDLSMAYTPGVADVCRLVAEHPEKADDYTIRGRTVAVVSDGSAVLGLGNIGPFGAMPVMEGKSLLFKEFAGVDSFPICLATQDPAEIIKVVKYLVPTFGGINLEDISAPRCFEIEDALQDIGIPVMHDDQHGTAVVVMAAMINSAKVAGKSMGEMTVAVSGAGAAGVAVSKILLGVNVDDPSYKPVKNLIVCDSKGIISRNRKDMHPYKYELAKITNKENKDGSLADAMSGADAFIGLSAPGIVSEEMVRGKAPNSIVFAMANPVPEIMPDKAKEAGAKVVGTGRSDFPNQINNVLGFPGIFRGTFDAKAKKITPRMKVAAAKAIAACVENPTADRVIPPALDKSVAERVAEAVKQAAIAEGVAQVKE